MDSHCQSVRNYYNLLKNRTVIGTEFMQQLRAQELEFRLVRLFGIYPTLILISITGAIHRLIPNAEKVTLFHHGIMNRQEKTQ